MLVSGRVAILNMCSIIRWADLAQELQATNIVTVQRVFLQHLLEIWQGAFRFSRQDASQVAVNNREREVKKRKSGKAKASYKDKVWSVPAVVILCDLFVIL